MTHVPVSRERHEQLRWRRYADYGFARAIQAVDVGLAETPKLCPAMPILFRQAGEGFAPVALLGVEAGRNDFVAPDLRWVTSYVPAALRGHPFAIAPGAEGQLVLCVDPASVTDGAGEAFFGEDGAPSAAVKAVMDFLQQVETSRQAARSAAAALARLGVLKPYALSDPKAPETVLIEGLFSVDEAVLAGLAEADFAGLRATGAIKLAYHQLLSLELWPALLTLSLRQRSHRDDISQHAAAIYRPADDGELQIDWSQFKPASPP